MPYQSQNWRSGSSPVRYIDSEYRHLKNIDIDIAIVIFENIDIDKAILKNIDIYKEILENIDIDKGIV